MKRAGLKGDMMHLSFCLAGSIFSISACSSKLLSAGDAPAELLKDFLTELCLVVVNKEVAIVALAMTVTSEILASDCLDIRYRWVGFPLRSSCTVDEELPSCTL